MQPFDLRLVLTVPCLNEELSIPNFFMNIKKFKAEFDQKFEGYQLSIVIVDNGSVDQTVQLLKDASEGLNFIHLLKCDKKGYGAALKKGFRYSHEELQADFNGFCDLDNTYPLPAFLEMYDLILSSDCDIVYADRLDGSEGGLSFTRSLGNKIYAFLCQFFFNSSLNDVCTGQRIFKKSRAEEVLQLKDDGLSFSIDFTCCVLKRKWSYQQVSINYEDRIGESKLSVIKDGFTFLITILKWVMKST